MSELKGKLNIKVLMVLKRQTASLKEWIYFVKRAGGERQQFKRESFKVFPSKVLAIFPRVYVPHCDDNEINRINHRTTNKSVEPSDIYK